MEYNNSSYYRANPYYKQGYIMDGALQNRILNQRLGQIPQGEKYFPKTSKKLFTNIKEKSEIRQFNLLQIPSVINHANQRFDQRRFSRNLDTKDIQGAIANTLKSQVIKVRQKSSNKEHSKPYLQLPQLKQQLKYSRKHFEQNQQLFNLVSRKSFNNQKKKNQSKQKIIPQIRNENEIKIVKDLKNEQNIIDSYRSIDLHQLKDRKQIKSSVNLSIKNEIPKINYLQQIGSNKQTIQKQVRQNNMLFNENISKDLLQKNNNRQIRYLSQNKQKIIKQNRKIKINPTFLSYNSTNLLNLAGRNVILT